MKIPKAANGVYRPHLLTVEDMQRMNDDIANSKGIVPFLTGFTAGVIITSLTIAIALKILDWL